MDDRTEAIEFTNTNETKPASRRRRRLLVAAALLLVLVLVAGLVGRGGSSSRAAAGESGQGIEALEEVDDPEGADSGGNIEEAGDGDSTEEVEADAIDEASEESLDAADNSKGYPDSGGNVEEPGDSGSGNSGETNEVTLEPLPGTGCAETVKTGRSLLVTPDPAVLPAGTMSSALSVTNCGANSLDWTAATVPSVTLGSQNGTLDAGSTTKLDFTIDADAYEPGAISFKIKVSEPGHNQYATVHAFRTILGKDTDAGGDQLSGGQQAGGCANQCIVKAWLTPTVTSPNLKLDVKTHTPATIRVWWGKQPQNGLAMPKATSPKDSTTWTTQLSQLEPATKYYALLKATDADGKVSSRSTSFTTITPYANPDGLANPGGPAGCSLQCITKAVLSDSDTFSSKRLEATSHTAARFQAFASTKAPTYNNGVPSFVTAESSSLSGLEYITSWKTELNALKAATKYHIIVRATDKQGRDAYQVGSFHTHDEPTHDFFITLHSIRVTHDGDASWKNRGELSFAWGVGHETAGTRAEAKMHDPATVSFPRNAQIHVAKGVKGFLPTVYVSALERDADGLAEWCSMGPLGVELEWGRNDDCDAKWNVASSGLVRVEEIDDLSHCSEFGLDPFWADKRCMLLDTVSHGDDYARFAAVISIEQKA